MRKSIKILTILLSVVLLFALAATAISAANSPTYVKPTAATYQPNGNARDFETTDAYDSAGKFVSSKVVLGSNTYNRVTNQQADGTFDYTTKGRLVSLPNPYLQILYRDYITMELDIMADKYTNGTDLITIEEYNSLSDSAKEEYYPSYPEAFFYLESELWNFEPGQSAHIKRSGDKWYVCAGNSTAASYPLPDQAGKWTHISFIIKVGNM